MLRGTRAQRARKSCKVGTLAFLLGCGADDGSSRGGFDADAPTVIYSVPADEAVDVDSKLGEITVTFSETMAIEGWSWVTEVGRSAPVVTGLPFYVDGSTTVLPVRLAPDTEYVIWVNSPDDADFRKFASADGVPARAHRIGFRTAPAPR